MLWRRTLGDESLRTLPEEVESKLKQCCKGSNGNNILTLNKQLVA